MIAAVAASLAGLSVGGAATSTEPTQAASEPAAEAEPEPEETSRASGPSSSAAGPEPRPTAGGYTWPFRESRARKAGQFAREKLELLSERVPPTPVLFRGLNEKRVWVLLRGAPGVQEVGCFVGPWRDFAGYVSRVNGELAPEAIFHGWASQREARCYWEAAIGVGVPWPVLVARPL